MIQEKTKIVFFLPDLSYGGAQKTIVNIANNISTRINSYQIYLFIVNNKNQILKINNNIKILDFKSNKAIKCFFKLNNEIKKIKPDFFISTIVHLNILSLVLKFYIRKNKVKFIIRETNPTFYRKDIGVLLKFLVKLIYPYSYKIICLSDIVKSELIKNIKNIEDKTYTIHNPIDFNDIKNKSNQNINYKFLNKKINFIYVGRFSYQKNIPYLISFLSMLDINFKFLLIGDGKEKNKINNIINNKKIKSKIEILPFTKNPFPYIRKSDIFLLPSRWEGFGHVIAESLSCNTPVICFNTHGIIKEFIDTGNVVVLNEAEQSNQIKKFLELIKNKFQYSNIDISKIEKLFNTEKITEIFIKKILS